MQNKKHFHNVQEFPCHLDHPIYEVLSNKNRREILRMIAYDSSNSYGRRLAAILDLSNTAIQRHLKILQDKTHINNFSLIKEKEKIKESYSGKKGGEAIIFEIGTKIGMFVGIFPDLIHSHVFISKLNNKLENTNLSEINPVQNTSEGRFFPLENSNDPIKNEYLKLYTDIQKINHEIIEQEKKLLSLLERKNNFLANIEKTIKKDSDLGRNDILYLKLIACLGSTTDREISYAFHIEEPIVKSALQRLEKIGWIVEDSS